MWSVYILIFLTFCAGLAGWLWFLWSVKSGQFDDIEGPKYRILDDDDEGRAQGKDKKPEAKQ